MLIGEAQWRDDPREMHRECDVAAVKQVSLRPCGLCIVLCLIQEWQ